MLRIPSEPGHIACIVLTWLAVTSVDMSTWAVTDNPPLYMIMMIYIILYRYEYSFIKPEFQNNIA